MRLLVHYSLHLIAPTLAARLFGGPRWWRAALIVLGTMLVDADHLLAVPIYQADRCSIGFHPLHTGWAVAVYAALLVAPGTVRIVAAGLLWHMATDLLDCVWMQAGV